MPYDKLSELPEAVRKLPGGAKRIFRAAFNAAHKQYGDEERSFKVAWAAVKQKYKKSGDKWVSKEQSEGMTEHLAALREVYRTYFDQVSVDESCRTAAWELLARVEEGPERDPAALQQLEDLCVPCFAFEQNISSTDAMWAPHAHDYPGSLEHRCRVVASAAREQLMPKYVGKYGGIVAVYPEFVVTCRPEEGDEYACGFEYYRVAYSFDEMTGSVAFGDAEEVEVLTIVVPSSMMRGEEMGESQQETPPATEAQPTEKHKTDNGQQFSKGAYLIIGDEDKPSTWRVRVEETPGKVTVQQLGRAYATLTNLKVSAEVRQAALSHLQGLYRHRDVPFPGDKDQAPPQAVGTQPIAARDQGGVALAEAPVSTITQQATDEAYPDWLLQGHDPPGGDEDLIQSLAFALEQVADAKVKRGVMRIRGIATVGNVVNSKNEVYPTSIWQDNVPRLQEMLQAGKLVGESDHPADHRPSLDRTCMVYRSIWMDGDQMKFEADVLPTDPSGKNLQTLIQNGVSVDISSRGRGNRVKGDWVHPSSGERYQGVYVVQRGFRCDALDSVVAGASPGATITDYDAAQHSAQGAAEEELDMERLEALTQQVEKLAAGQAQVQELILKLAGGQQQQGDGQPQGDGQQQPPPQNQQQGAGMLSGGPDLVLAARMMKALIKDRKAELLEEAQNVHKLPPIWLQSFKNCLDESNVATVEELESHATRSLAMIVAAFEKAPKFPGSGFVVQQDAGERPGPKTPREMIEFLVKDLPDDDGDAASWVRQGADGETYIAPDHVRTPRRQVRQILTNISKAEIDGWNGPATLQAYVRMFQGHDHRAVTEAWMDQACSDCTTSTAASGAPSSAIFIFPLVRRVFPQLIAPEIASVQPMDRPDGRIFFLDAYRISTGVNSVDEGGNVVENKMRIDRSESFNSSYSDRAAECDTANCLTLRLSSKTVAAQTKALHAIWTIEELQDLRAYHNLDVASELVASLAREVALEWNQIVLQEMLDGATAGARNFGTVAPSGYTQKEWDEYLVRYLEAASTDIFKKRHGDMTHVIAGPSAWLQLSASFRAGIKPSGPNPEMFAGLTLTPFMAGATSNVKTYKTSFWTGVNTNKILVIRRGADWSDTPYVWAPYIDYVSPTLTLPDNFTQKQGVMSRAAHKVVVGDAMATITIQSGVTGATVT